MATQRVRYIRDTLKSSGAISNNWIEIRAFNASNQNVAQGKTVTSNFGVYGPNLVDGSSNNTNAGAGTDSVNPAWVMVDLGSVMDIQSINIVHYYYMRTYGFTMTEVSEDGVNWIVVADTRNTGTYLEPGDGSGKTYNAPFAITPKPPTAPVIDLLDIGDSKAYAYYTVPEFDGNAPITSYEFEVTPATGQSYTTPANNPYIINGLTNNTQYSIRMRAINSAGPGTWSTAKTVTPVYIAPDVTPPTVTSIYVDTVTKKDLILVLSEKADTTSIPAKEAFTVSNNTVTAAALVAGDQTRFKVTVGTAFTGGEVVKASYAKPGTNPLQDMSGNDLESFSNKDVTNSLFVKPVVPGVIVKTFGDDPGADFQTVDQVINFVQPLDLVTNPTPVWIYCYKNFDMTGKQLGPQNSSEEVMVVLKPAPGYGFDDLEPDTAPGAFGNVGLTLQTGGWCAFRCGMDVTGWRVYVPAGATFQFRRDRWEQGGPGIKFRRNRIRAVTDGKIWYTGEYANQLWFEDNLVELDSNSTQVMCDSGYKGIYRRNTFVRKNGAAGKAGVLVSAQYANDNVFSQCTGSPAGTTDGDHNYSDTPVASGANTGITYVSAPIFQSALNYRPGTGTVVVGGGSLAATSINDNSGNNRGTSPDAGAFQLNPAPPLVVASVTKQETDGMTRRLEFTTTNTPTSGKVTLTPADPADGAVSVGPLDLVIGNGVASVDVDDIPAGNYRAPTVTFTNAGGTAPVFGLEGFTIMGFGNLVYDPDTASPATAVTASVPPSSNVGVPVTIQVGLDGAKSGMVVATPSDNGAGGTFNPPTATINNGAVTSQTYTRPTAGTSTITYTNDAGLANPVPATYTAVALVVPAPTISIVSTAADLMVGKKATIGGSANLQGDASGKVEVFIEPQSGGATQGPFVAAMNGSVWSVTRNLSAGSYRIIARATANGKTAEAVLNNVVVRSLSGKSKLPTT